MFALGGMHSDPGHPPTPSPWFMLSPSLGNPTVLMKLEADSRVRNLLTLDELKLESSGSESEPRACSLS